MTSWSLTEVFFGVLCVLLAVREILHIAYLGKASVQCSRRGRERRLRILRVAWLLLIAIGPIGHHGLIVIKDLYERPSGAEPIGDDRLPPTPRGIWI